MKKRISLLAIICFLIVLAMSLVGCGGKTYDYTYEFTFEGGQVSFKSNNIYEITKDNKAIGFISVNGENKDDGAYVEEKIENYTMAIYIIATYDREKLQVTSSNTTLSKQANVMTEDINDVTQHSPLSPNPAPSDPYYFEKQYKLSKNSKENIKINISGLELFSAIDYNWELYAIGRQINESEEEVTVKDAMIYIGTDVFKVGDDLQINLNLMGDSKTLFQKYGDRAGTVAIDCVFENGNYLVTYDDQKLTANIIFSNKGAISNKQLLKLNMGDDMFAYLCIKK